MAENILKELHPDATLQKNKGDVIGGKLKGT